MAQQQQRYYEKLDISLLKISSVKRIIKTNIINTLSCWDKGENVDKQCFHIIGPAGVGKTQICEQIAKELTKELGIDFEMIMVKSPVLSRDDFLIPFPVTTKDGQKKKFEMLYSDFVPDGEDTYGLFIIDEFSRGDHSLQQLMWQIQNEYKVHLKDMPKGWFVISVDNPDEAEYNIDNMEDAAGLRRQLHVYVDVDTKDFLNYAMEVGFHPTVTGFITTYPQHLYDTKAKANGAVFANPASYERLSNILKGYESNGGIMQNLDDFEVLASGLINTNMARLFMEYVRDTGSVIKPEDIVHNYDNVEAKIRYLVTNNDTPKLSELMDAFMTYLTHKRPKIDDNMVNSVKKFLTVIPIDTAATFVTSVDSLGRGEEFKYMMEIQDKAFEDEDYRTEFHNKIVELRESQNV